MDIYHSYSQDHISQRTVVSQVMERLKQLIASGHYRPGDRLPTEQKLAAMFGVGRSSIREAIKVFQHLGVVESRTAKGTFLRDRADISSEAITWALLLGDDDLQDVMELREAIESVCFARLSEGVSAGSADALNVIGELDAQVRAMHEAAKDSEAQRLVEADYRFHGHIVAAGGNELFRALYANLHAFMNEEIRRSYTETESLAEVARDHEEIVQALRKESPQRCRERHQEHFGRTRKLLRMSATRQPATI